MAVEPLTPLRFLRRSARIFEDRTAVVDGARRYSYGELLVRARRQAGLLKAAGLSRGDRVAVLAPNSALLLEAHYGVPMAGGVLVALNVRLSAAELSYILDHSGTRILLYDEDLGGLATALDVPTAIPVSEYEAALDSADEVEEEPEDEWDLLSLNYTSGTTGRPKGVMYHHRGAYLQALAMAFHGRLAVETVHLWTLPMFHCNGWCFTWAVTAAGATHVCLRRVAADAIWESLRAERVTSLNAAPTVLSDFAWHSDARPGEQPIRVATGGAPPSPSLLARLAELNVDVTHLYGLTETFGPAVVCEQRPEWSDLDLNERARMNARQGNVNVLAGELQVLGEDGVRVPADGTSLGEVALRGDNVMLGYYRDPDATRAAIPDGWLRTGDLGVLHPDGYVELRDRAKDVIISGGENVASIEVEQALASHAAVLEAAVIGVPDERWGEIPVAYVAVKHGHTVSDRELIEHVRERIARFKAPKRVVFGPLPKTSTGKVQKFLLRRAARELGDGGET